MGLPLDATWHLHFSSLGTHTSLGVATRDCELYVPTYIFLFGKGRNDSWALNFDRTSFWAHHEDSEEIVSSDPMHRELKDDVHFVLRRLGNELFVRLPGQDEEKLVFANLPTATT